MPGRFEGSGAWKGVVVAAMIALLSSCAHGPAVLVSPGGRLDVANALPEPVEVFVDGGRVALLEPGATAFLDRLPRRAVTVEATGMVSGNEFRRELDLRTEDPVRWQVEAVGAQKTDYDRARSGVLIVDNRADEPVRPFLAGKAADLVYPGTRVAFTGLELGRRTVEAVGVRTDFRVSMDVMLANGTTAVFVVTSPAAAVRVRNLADLPIRLYVGLEDSETRHDLASGEGYVIRGLAAGSELQLRADDGLGRPFWTGSVTALSGKVVDVAVPSPAGMLSVLSEFEQPVTILADGRLLGTCPPQGAAEFSGLVPGTARVQAFADDGTVLARTRMRITPGDKPLWFLRPGTTQETGEDEGGLLVVNGTDEILRLQIDGWDRGAIEPGQRRQFEGLVPGKHAVAAAGKVSGDVFWMRDEVVKGSRATWTVLPGNATLEVHNLRGEAVRLLVDDEPIGEVAAGASSNLAVPAGERLVEAVGVTSLDATRHRLDLPASAVTRLDLQRPFATVRVVNLQSNAVEVSADQGILGVVEPGQAAVFDRVAPGECRLTAQSIDLPVTWNILLWLTAGDVYDWNLGMPGTN